MHFFANMNTLICVASIAIGLVAATPICSDVAGGGLPNSGRPLLLSPAAVKDLQLALFLENLEVAYFSSGLSNITMWGINGYPNDTIGVQKEIHVATIIDLLEAYNEIPIPPCNYSFPVNSTEQFFELADIITSVGIGATIGLAKRLAFTDPLLIKPVASILAVESRHDAFFRHIEGEVPNPAPSDTGISSIWAYNFALSFIDPAQMTFIAEAGKQLLVGWVNQLDVPVYTPLNITVKGQGTALVPQGMNGAAFAVVTTQRLDNADDLALATLAGPVVVKLS
ncbi:hypothetical protein G7Y89_g13460 [Cudoniella acicularis]|uniref:Uncharacterized protein n=1 Tax=Cudoniella acicularis TaxID=354080 RepID=A0A8H4R6V4_9HELO|nr:hypothetical protein G7Y89_g13460 [Cudoniella acicularis]